MVVEYEEEEGEEDRGKVDLVVVYEEEEEEADKSKVGVTVAVY